jgi:hypothetical protein
MFQAGRAACGAWRAGLASAPAWLLPRRGVQEVSGGAAATMWV